MSTMNTRTKLYVYCEGKSEANYVQGLKKNEQVNENYVLTPLVETNDLKNAICDSENNPKIFRNSGIGFKVLFFYDADVYDKGRKQINELINQKKQDIYLSRGDFEDFLKSHKTKKPYKDNKKSHLTSELLKELEHLDLKEIKSFNKPAKFKDFKTLYDFLIELFSKKF